MKNKFGYFLLVIIMALTASLCAGGLLEDFSKIAKIISVRSFWLDFLWFLLIGFALMSWKWYMNTYDPKDALLKINLPLWLTLIVVQFNSILSTIFDIFGLSFPG